MYSQNYNTFIAELVNKFKKNIPENNEFIIKKFEEYLYDTIEHIENSASKFISKDRKSIENTLTFMTDQLINLSLDEKKQRLLPDENYEKIKKISYTAFDIAQKKLLNVDVTDDIDVNSLSDEITSLLNVVEKFNKKNAEQLVSETILDLQFIDNPKTEYTSLRLGHIIQDMKNQEEEER